MEEILKIGKYLVDNAEKIIRDITEEALKNIEIPVTDEMLDQSIQQNVEFLVLIAESFGEQKKLQKPN